MKNKFLIIMMLMALLVSLTGCTKKEKNIDKPNKVNENFNVGELLDTIINEGPKTSSNPFDYIKESQKEYDLLLTHPNETFAYSIKDLIETNATNGLKSYLEALLCKEINKNFDYDFESARDYLEHYTEYLTNSQNNFNDYDNYAKSLLK